jgi:hypothetical protein
MPEPASPFLTAWSSFYLMTASSAAALTGLMFVVITLVTGAERLRSTSADGLSTFSTPTVMHFAAALLVSAILSAPWHSLVDPAILLGVAGLWGVIYVLRVSSRAKRLTNYSPDAEDWAFYSIFPFVAYGVILVGALMLPFIPGRALFWLAGGVALLIFMGIRNAWDVVTFIATGGPNEPPSSA